MKNGKMKSKSIAEFSNNTSIANTLQQFDGWICRNGKNILSNPTTLLLITDV